MYKTVRFCAKSRSLLNQISSQPIIFTINHTWIQSRSMRKFIRYPAKVLTDDGHDYDTFMRTQQRVSDIKDELSRDLMKKLNPSSDEYYDEAVYDHNNELNYSRKKAKSFKQSNNFDDDNNELNYSRKNAKSFKQSNNFDDDNNELNYSRKKTKSFKQSNDFDDDNNELNYSRKNAKSFKQSNDFDDNNNELNYSRKNAKSFKQSNDFDDDNNELNYSRKNAKSFKQSNDFDDDNNELNYSRKNAKSFKQSNDFDDNSENQSYKKARDIERPVSQTKEKQNQFSTPWKPSKVNEKPKSEKELKPRNAGIPVYEKLGENSREFFNIMTTIKMRSRREKSNLFLLEGIRIINDAIDANIVIENFYFSKEENLVGIKNLTNLVQSGVGLKKVFYKDIKLFTDMVTSPGVMAICVKPDNQQITETYTYTEELKLPLIVVCDNIRDPGNMGTLIRSCAAFGVEKMVLTNGCVDAWESKVVRSGSGAHFRIPIFNNVEWANVPDYLLNDNLVDVFLAESNPSERILDSSNIKNEYNSHDNQSPSNDTKELKKYITQTPLLSLMYNETDFFSKSLNEKTVLVIGGETHGLSVESYKFAHQFNGSRVKIPLSFGVDSLNSTTAATIIIFEMKRQYLKRYSEQSNQNIVSVV